MPILHEGVRIELGGRAFVMPPLTLKHLRIHGGVIRSLGDLKGIPSDQDVDGIVTLIHAALSRNYPELTREEIEDLVDVTNLAPTFQAMVGQSGLTRVAKDAASGEVTP